MVKSAEFMNREELISHIHTMHGFNIREGEPLRYIFDMHEMDHEDGELKVQHCHEIIDDDALGI